MTALFCCNTVLKHDNDNIVYESADDDCTDYTYHNEMHETSVGNVTGVVPSWLLADDDHRSLCIAGIVIKELYKCGNNLGITNVTKLGKADLLSVILQRLHDIYTQNIVHSLNEAGIDALKRKIQSNVGPVIFERLRCPPRHMKHAVDIGLLSLTRPWLRQDKLDQIRNCKKVSKENLKLSIISQLASQQIHFRSNIRSMSTSLVEGFRNRAIELGSYSLCDLISDALCYEDRICSYSRVKLERLILEKEYKLFHILSSERFSRSQKNSIVNKKKRRITKLLECQKSIKKDNIVADRWPSIVSEDTVLGCLNDYRLGTEWKEPDVCAVCSRRKFGSTVKPVVVSMSVNEPVPLNINMLKMFFTPPPAYDPYYSKFPHEFILRPEMRGLLFDRDGVVPDIPSQTLQISICSECKLSLSKADMPKYALANRLYRGILPDEFKDLTWIEEMVCAIYRTTAIVCRIYSSGDVNAAPRFFKGNTCAHDVNLLSTANVLPRTPSDINDCLSVVFIGSKKKLRDALSPFFIRKKIVIGLLHWLKQNNVLYREQLIDWTILNLYSDNDVLPGLVDRVIVDEETDPKTAFSEETAGLADHPLLDAENDPEHQNESASPIVVLEHTGVSDPEGSDVSGRDFKAAGVRNLLRKQNDEADMKIYHSAHAIVEYKNPRLILGIFPSMYPFGFGSFEDPLRQTPISFESQADYTFDLNDRCFRYHHTYIFIVWNIIQRRKGHLSTYLSVKRSQFREIAKKLTSVSAKTLEYVAKYIEHEGKITDLNDEGQRALDLLSHVHTVNGKVPGSQSAKLTVRNSIRSYFAYFGLPHIYLTLNPAPAHNPIFQVMFGDKTVDLTKQFPIMVSARERVIRLAKDPVAAADFFDFLIHCFFEHLMGWDYKEGKSKESGGIFGHLHAFYGTAEYTERGTLHGHFLLWLKGGMNPSDVHKKLKGDTDFERRFFAYWESIIHHQLPNIECNIDPSHEPKAERPPVPPLPHFRGNCSPEEVTRIIESWDSVCETEIKICGEKLQRHDCRPVCHKYGHNNDCRFGFPHEIVDASYFDPETNSIYLLCHDATVNYYNPFILIFCRHNHDARCILSGRAAKAAMFYISDYITKMDLKTYEILSLLSKAVLNAAQVPTTSPVHSARTLLHKCLTQFNRKQQIHAQQAARYIRKHNDGIPSHKTVPMLSGAWLSYWQDILKVNQNLEIVIDGNEEHEDTVMKIHVNDDGTLKECNQIIDYLYRADTLKHMNFYQFCRCTRTEDRTTSRTKNTADTRLGVYTRHSLKPAHPLHGTHVLVEHTNIQRGDGCQIFIPRVIGISIPSKRDKKKHALFMLAHFKPCNIDEPLMTITDSVEDVYDRYEFDEESKRIMNNFDAIHECEDEREAERIRKASSRMKVSKLLVQSQLPTTENNDDDETDTHIPLTTAVNSAAEFRALQTLLNLDHAGWFSAGKLNERSHSKNCDIQNPTRETLEYWKTFVKNKEREAQTFRRNMTNLTSQQQIVTNTTNTGHEENVHVLHKPITQFNCAKQKSISETATSNVKLTCESPNQLLDRIATEFNLNQQQTIAYKIITKYFLQLVDKRRGVSIGEQSKIMLDEPLRAFITGPGGTGKTHVVNALKHVMSIYQCLHRIRLLAPTGTAASSIGGTTIHSGLGIQIRKTSDTMHSHTIYVTAGVKNRTRLREEWKDVDFVMIDETSMVGGELLCEIDYALRFAKEQKDLWFGAMNMIFAGDFHQFPPIGGTPLYSPLMHLPKTTAAELHKRLGRLAWKSVTTVVELHEQQRMKDDPQMAEAVQHLRVRKCTYADEEFFNSRVLKSVENETGVSLDETTNNISVIVPVNYTREVLNNHKARAICTGPNSPTLISCAAHDSIEGRTITTDEQRQLLALNTSTKTSNGSLPGILPLFVGAAVILRNRNISVELGITNGQQGIVRKIITKQLNDDLLFAELVIVEFPFSKIHLPGLPKGHFPVEPVKWTTKVDLHTQSGIERVKVTRLQQPLQLGYVVTCHSAQGKTLENVVCSLSSGGFAAYVAASRARTRHNLFLTEPVTLHQLNSKLDYSLQLENERLEQLKHNTLIKEGYLSGELVTVTSPERESDQQPEQINVVFAPPPPSPTSLGKRRRL